MTVLHKNLFDGANITEINVSDAWNVTIVQDEQTSGVELEYSAFLEDYLNVKLTGFSLNIGFTTHLNLPNNTVMNAVIHVKTLEKLDVKEAVQVTLNSDFSGENIDIQLDEASVCRGGSFTGNAKITINDASQLVDFIVIGNLCEMEIKDASAFKGNLTADSLFIQMGDASRLITYGGQVQRMQMDLDDACLLNMVYTPVNEAFVNLESASEATLQVNTLLQGSLKEASVLYYEGNPIIDLDCDTSSSFGPL